MSLDVGALYHPQAVIGALARRCTPAEWAVLSVVAARWAASSPPSAFRKPSGVVDELLACATDPERDVIQVLACAEGVLHRCRCGQLDVVPPRTPGASRKCGACALDYA